MTITANAIITIEHAADNLIRIMADLAEAKAEVALLERLKGAEARVEQLTAEQATAVIRQQELLDAEDKARADARFTSLSSIRVVDKTPDEHAIRSSFEITYTQLTWNSPANASLYQEHTIVGFSVLPPVVLEYLIEKHPAQIPAKIMALSDSPVDAFDRYFVALKRGHLNALAA